MSRQRKSARPRSRQARRGNLGFWASLGCVLILAAYLGVLELSRPHVSGARLRLDTFITLAENDRIRNAEILDYDSYVVGEYARDDGSIGRYAVAYLKVQNTRERLTTALVDNRVPTRVNQQTLKGFIPPLLFLLPSLLMAVIIWYFILSYRSETGPFAIRSGARRLTPEQTASFAEVAGQDTAVAELRELADFLADPDRFAEVGVQIPKGVLLYGPPGCGKTLLARALAGEAGAAFYSISGSDFVEMYVGVGAARVRDLFREAREHAPAIVFIDELDALGRKRAGGAAVATGSREEGDQALNSLLAEMDGIASGAGILVVGATNRPDVLDQALLRPGRFDRSIGLETPDEQARLQILEVHAKGKPLAADADLARIANRAVGFTGADLANVVNEAGLLATRAGAREISQANLEEALDRIMDAPERQRRLAVRDRSLGRRSLSDEQVTFADIAALDEAVEEVAEVREYLRDPDRFLALGARIPRGFLLSGPPGCGKTLLAKAVAGESNAAFFSVSGSEFTEVYVGEGAARVRDLFAEARGVAPAIVFIDELDAMGGRRGAAVSGGGREYDQTLNQILVELDGFSARDGVVVMGATNRPDMLDPALVRPGRFDRVIALDLPDRAGRLRILELHARGKPLAPDVDLERLAALTSGLAGADLANILNEAALLAARRGRREIDMELIDEGLERAVAGVASGRLMTDEERRVVAYHEAGHGIVALALPGAERMMVHKLSIVPRGARAGVAWIPETDDSRVRSRSALVRRMAVSLGGRAAEELVFGEAYNGAGSDLQHVGEIARMMVRDLGMGESAGAPATAAVNDRDGDGRVSEETARIVDEEVRAVVAEAEALARDVVRGEREALDRVAEALLDRETLTLDDIERLVGPAGSPAR